MDEKQRLERLMLAVEQMRAAQRMYFKTQNSIDKKTAIGAELHVDAMVTHYRRQGYDPDRHDNKSSQSQIF